MIKKMSPYEIHRAVKALLDRHLGLPVYDSIPLNAPAPLVYIELVSVKPDNTKTMWVDTFEFFMHIIAEAEATGSNAIYEYMNRLDEALTESIEIPAGCELLSQRGNGLQVLKTDVTGEKHAVVSYQFKICYGFKVK